MVRWSVDHASYVGTAPGARTERGIVAGVPDLFVLLGLLDAWGIPRARRLAVRAGVAA